MIIFNLLSWWYVQGWGWVLLSSQKHLQNVSESFSVSILLRTLFSPWKQIQSEVSFRNFLQSQIDNFISRFIGFVVRLAMLVGACFLTIFIILSTIVVLILWAFVPLSVIIFPALGIRGYL